MKIAVVLFGVLAVALAKPSSILHSAYNYHANIGIHEAARIKQAETALDFDGSRIIGGSPSQLGTNPHLGGLVITLRDSRQSVCGSSLLTHTKAVTAAHCWWDGENQAYTFTVVLGTLGLFSGGTRRNTNNVVMHPEWSPDTAHNDVAIITMNHVDYSNNILPIGLARGKDLYERTFATAAGYGLTSNGGNLPRDTVQRHVRLQVISNEECKKVYGNSIIDSSICVSTEAGASVCGGDSGGPLYVGVGHDMTLIGVTSFVHKEGCSSGKPAGFARVSALEAWILSRL